MEDRRIEEDEVVQQPDGYRIMELSVSNIKRIKAVNITPKDDLVILEGDNAQGKTSIMDSISYLLGGKRLIPDEPIRKGETEGFVKATIGSFEVTRRWTNPYVSTVHITTKKGEMNPGNPQTFLNERIGSVSLEVAELVNMDKDDRIKVFKRITGLNLNDLTEKHGRVMELRKDRNRDLARMEAELKNYSELPDIEEGLDFDKLQTERKERESDNETYLKKKNDIIELIDDRNIKNGAIDDSKTQIEEYEKDIADLKLGINQTALDIERVTEEITVGKKELEAMVKTDLTEIDKKIKKTVDLIELKVKHERSDEIKKDISATSEKIDKYNNDLDAIKHERTTRIKDSKVPVEGVEFDGESIRYKGIEFEECSTAEQIEISIAIGIKENPKIRIILIRDGSAIGKAAMEKIKQMAKENNFQIWVERVAESKGNEIFIEDGEIK